MYEQHLYISSDELRAVTKSGGSWHQIQRLFVLGIPFSLDAYGTPQVRRADLEKYKNLKPWISKFADQWDNISTRVLLCWDQRDLRDTFIRKIFFN